MDCDGNRAAQRAPANRLTYLGTVDALEPVDDTDILIICGALPIGAKMSGCASRRETEPSAFLPLGFPQAAPELSVISLLHEPGAGPVFLRRRARPPERVALLRDHSRLPVW